MNIVARHRFGPVQAFQLGYGPIGPPLMSVYCYLVDDVLIDTGQRRMQAALAAMLAATPIRKILLTHHHEDHSGNAAAISRRFQAPVHAHPLAAAKMQNGYSIRLYQHVVWGKAEPTAVLPPDPIVATAHGVLTPLHTPGHSKDHVVYYDRQNGRLFSGDLFIGERIKFFRSDERLHDQIASLHTVLALDFDALFCGHNPCPVHGKRRLANKLAFLEEFRGRVAQMKNRGLSQAQVVRELDRGQDRLVKWITMGNASFANMVGSAYGAARQG